MLIYSVGRPPTSWGVKIVAGEAARDPEGLDRNAMHEVMNREIIDFFDRKLPSGQKTSDMGTQPTPDGFMARH
jgi:hypothetical protein